MSSIFRYLDLNTRIFMSKQSLAFMKTCCREETKCLTKPCLVRIDHKMASKCITRLLNTIYIK